MMLKEFEAFIRSRNLFQKTDKILVAVSGGIDSISLCSLLHSSGYLFGIAHCNFKLRNEESEKDEKFCKKLAKSYQVTFHTKSFETVSYARESKISIQMAARELRYQWLEKIRSDFNYTYIATAHHKDDEIETVLLNLIRGTGLKGLHGIRIKKEKIIRPLLFARKNSISRYAKKQKLQYVTDSSNASDKYDRNKLRNKIIPAIKEINPNIQKTFEENIERFKESEEIYDQAIHQIKSKLVEKDGDEIKVHIFKLLKYKGAKTILFEILKEYGFNNHQTANMYSSFHHNSGKVFYSKTDRVIKDRNTLIISPIKSDQINFIEISEGQSSVKMGNLHLKMSITENKSITIPTSPNYCSVDCNLLQFPLLLRRWRKGDYFYPFGMKSGCIKEKGSNHRVKKGKKKLSDYFTDKKLSLSDKEKVWVLCSGKKIVWVVGFRMDDRFRITNKTKKICILEKIDKK